MILLQLKLELDHPVKAEVIAEAEAEVEVKAEVIAEAEVKAEVKAEAEDNLYQIANIKIICFKNYKK
tara:strand:+ start:92 stop:292 length:201 start_codon:yes stop_codon:yes gene_type:complete